MLGEGRCSNTKCTLPPNHPGPCNNTTGFHPNVPEIPLVKPSGATRGARAREQLQTVAEEQDITESDAPDVTVDACMVHVLHTAYTSQSKEYLAGGKEHDPDAW